MERGRTSWRIMNIRAYDSKPKCTLKKRFSMKRFFRIKDPQDATDYKVAFNSDPDSNHDAFFII